MRLLPLGYLCWTKKKILGVICISIDELICSPSKSFYNIERFFVLFNKIHTYVSSKTNGELLWKKLLFLPEKLEIFGILNLFEIFCDFL